MSDLTAQFEQAQEDVKGLSSKPSNEQLLALYSLFKQATQGDVSGKRPGFTNPVGRAKHDAWAEQKGSSKDDAMQKYVDLVKSLVG